MLPTSDAASPDLHPSTTDEYSLVPPSNPNLDHVFISYSRRDKVFVDRLIVDLEARGVRVWIDNLGLKPGTRNWEKALRNAIRNCYAALLIASPESGKSDYVQAELAIAEMYERPLYPIWAGGTHWIECVPMELVKTQHIDLRGDSYEQNLNAVVTPLLQLQGKINVVTETVIMEAVKVATRNPYKGLRSFTGEDANDFFGRDALIKDLLEATAGLDDTPDEPERMLAVVGPSGSGKSSVVMAGLLPRLQAGALPGSANWVYLPTLVPGQQPLENLAISLSREINWDIESILRNLEDQRGLHRLVSVLAREPNQRAVLFIDQFEELFTQTTDEDERRRFISQIVTAATEPRGSLIVVLTLRADFYDRPMQYPALGRLLEHRSRSVLPMSVADLRSAIEKPAALKDVNLRLEEGLVGDLLFEVHDQAGALPLLQFTLSQLFDQRDGNLLSLEAYREIGGVRGALSKHAEATYAGLKSDTHRALAKTLFIRLIELGVNEQDTTRRRARKSELILPDPDQTAMLDHVAAVFVTARLLVTDQMGGVETIEVSHEALIREWERLGNWLREAREDIRLQMKISTDVAEWLRQGKNPDLLYRGRVLRESLEWSTTNIANSDETAFLEAGAALEAEQAALEEQRKRELLETVRRAEQSQLEAQQATARAEASRLEAERAEKAALTATEESTRSARRARRLRQFALIVGMSAGIIALLAVLSIVTANTQVREAGETLTPIPMTLTPVGITLAVGSTQIAAANTQVAGFQPTLDRAETQIAGVEPTLDAGSTQIAAANTQVAGFQPTLDRAETQIAGVEPTLDAGSTQIAAANTQVAGFQPTLDRAETQIAGVAPTLVANATQLADAEMQRVTAQVEIGIAQAQALVAQNTQAAVFGQLTPLAATVQSASDQLLTATVARGEALFSVATAQAQATAAQELVSISAATAQADIQRANRAADVAETQVADANATLTPIPLTLTPIARTLAYSGTQIGQAQIDVTRANAAAARAEQQAEIAQQTLTPIPLTLTPVGATLAYAGTQILQAQIDVTRANAAAARAEQQAEIAQQTLTPIPLTLTPVGATLAYAGTQVSAAQMDLTRANESARVAQTAVSNANATLVPIPRTLTPIALTLALANTLVAGVRPTVDAAQTQVAGVVPTVNAAETQVAGVAPTLNAADTQVAGVQPTLTGVAQEVIRQSGIADSLRLAVQGEQLVQAGNPDLAMAMILEAYKLNTGLPQTQRILNSVRPVTVRFNFADLSISSRRTLTPQNHPVLAFSPDERTIAVPVEEIVQIWELSPRRLLHELPVDGNVTVMEFSPDGRYLIIGTNSNGLIMYEAGSGFEKWRSGRGNVTDFALSPDPTQPVIIIGFANNRAIIANYDERQVLYTLNEHDAPIAAVAFNANGTQAYAFDFDDTTPRISIVDFVTRLTRTEFPDTYRGLSPDGFYGVTGGDGTDFLTLWNPINLVRQRQFALHTARSDYVEEIVFSPDRRRVLVHVESRDYIDPARNLFVVTGRSIEVWNIVDGSRLLVLPDPADDPTIWDVHSLAMSDDGRYALTGMQLGAVHYASLWDLTTGQEMRRLTGYNAAVTSAALSANASYAYTTSGAVARVWDIGDAQTSSVRTMPTGATEIGGIALNAAGDGVYIAYNGTNLGTWSLATGQQDNERRTLTGAHRFVAFDPFQPYAAVATGDGLVIWDLTQASVRRDRIDAVSGSAVTALTYSREGHYLFIAEGRRVLQWDAFGGESVRSYTVRGSAHTLQTDNQSQFLLAAAAGTVQVIDLISGEAVFSQTDFASAVLDADLSPNADFVVAAFAEPANTVMIWNARTGALNYTLLGHTGSVTSAAFSADSRYILTGSADETLRVWDVRTGELVATFIGSTGAIRTAFFTSDGGTIISLSENDRAGVAFWRFESVQDTVDWVYANRYVPALTCDQRLQYNVRPLCVDGVAPSPTPSNTPIATVTNTPTNTPRPTPTITPTPLPTGRVISDTNANLRSGAGSGFRVVGSVAPGTTVTILETQETIGWLRIRTPDGTTGWILANLVQRR